MIAPVELSAVVAESLPRVALSPREVAAMVGVPYGQVLAAIKSGDLRAVEIGRHYRVATGELRRWIGEPSDRAC